MNIPHLIHFAVLGGPAPEWAEFNMQRFRELNPDYVVMVHGEEALDEAMRPGYDAITGEHKWARKSDILRVCILARYGGWWFDWDFLPFRPLADILWENDTSGGFFLTQGTPKLVANGVIGAAPESEGFRIVRRVVARMAERPIGREWGAFGPALYTRLAVQHPGMAVVGAQEMFYPLQDRDASRAAYVALRSDCSQEAVNRTLGAYTQARPYMLHMSMMDELTLPEVPDGR